MNSTCPPLESFEKLLALDPDDPRRVHLEECPRCSARLTAFMSFVKPEPLPAGVRLDDARTRLTEAIRREAILAQSTGRSLPFADLWDRISRPVWRPALGLVSLLLILLVIVRVTDQGGRESPSLLRGGEPFRDSGSPTSLVMPDGSFELRWPIVDGADAYRLLFYGTDLVEILRIEAEADTRMTLPRARLSQLGAAGSTVYWRVQALHGGDPVALSQPLPIRLP
jgi:hypothetical protein